MISPVFALWVLVGFFACFAILLPVLNVKLAKYISLRWMCIVVILALMIGVVVDFCELDDDSRHIVLLGGLIVVGGFILVRSIEKALFNGWLGRGSIKLTAQKGELKGSIEYDPERDDKRG